jgi:hypothetical protein
MNGDQHIIFRAADGHIHELYNSGNGGGWSHNDLTDFIDGTPAAGDPMGLAVGETQHIIFRDSSGHVRRYTCDPYNGWSEEDATALVQGGGALAAGAPFGYATATGLYIVFRTSTNQLHRYTYGGAEWLDQNLTTLVGGPGPASDPTAYYSGFVHILFRDTSSNVRELFYNGAWASNDLTFGGSPPVSGVMGYNSL